MIEEIYTEALLAAAAYADWGPSSSEAEIKAELINKRGFTEKQYFEFFDTSNPNRLYEVIPNGYTEDVNGFSATIFRNVDTTSPSYNQLTVSFRGTEPFTVDFLTDLLILLGNPDSVLEDFFNQNNNVDDFLDANNLILGGQLTQPVNFTGHSLGGYLALMASYKYSSSFGETSTFNGLGLNPLEDVWEDIKTTFVVRPLDETKIHNYFADKGWEGASSPLLSRPGGRQEIFIEYDGLIDDATFANHSIAKLVESLSGKGDATIFREKGTQLFLI